VTSKKAADSIDPVEYEEALSERPPDTPVALESQWDHLFKVCVIVVCVWAVIESPLELDDPIDLIGLLALVASKLMIGLIGTAAIANLRFAQQLFTFVCGAGVLAIAPALPLEYTRSVVIALLSTVECLGKTACVALFALASLARDLDPN
jgi:hypothetical protein